MFDPIVFNLVTELKDTVAKVNDLMEELESLGVEVRISYVESSPSKNIAQGISLWKVIEHIDHLKVLDTEETNNGESIN
jgi:hypothetical protein